MVKYCGSSKIKGEGSLDYTGPSEGSAPKETPLEVFLAKVNLHSRAYGSKDHEMKEPQKMINKLDAFIRKHTGVSYEEFLRDSKPEDFTENDYQHLSSPEEKKALFDKRIKTYLSA